MHQCVLCNDTKSIYGHMCSDCRILINGRKKENVKTESEEALKRPKRRKKQKILSTLDILISVFIVTPLVVACWRGTWQIMDVYSDYFPPWESFLIGTIIHIIIGISQETFHEILNRKHSPWVLNICVFFVMKSYTIVFNGVTNMSWRGAWIIIDEYFGIAISEIDGATEVKNGKGAFIFFTISFLIMFFMKSLRNLNSPPFELCLDYGDDMFLFPNMFKVKVSDKISLYVLDVIFSMGVVNNLGIIVWRGLWLFVDLFLFPHDQILSAWASTFLGFLMVAIVFSLQPIMKNICDRLNGVPKLLVADAYIMFSIMDVIFLWRGIWNLLNIYFLPDNPELSCWLTQWISMLFLILMGCSNSLLVRGVCADCEEPDGTCVVFPCDYLKVILDQERDDTWFSIWSGMNKTKRISVLNNINTINYHIVKIKEAQDEDSRNNNTEKGIS